MKYFEKLEDIKNIENSVVALGNFDGVHLGHQALIKKTVELAKEKGLKSAVFTFSNHPKNTLPMAKPVKNIIYNEEKRNIIESLGVDYLYNLPFTQEIMTMSPVAFVEKLLVDKLSIKVGVCGFNFHFGYRGEGNPDILRKIGDEKGFEVFEMEPVKIEGNVVSSSLIRTLIASGRVDRCKTYLGRNYEIGGEVVVGNRLGRKLGFPTSNLVIDDCMVTPPNGVYVTICDYDGKKYPSVTNVGRKPTVGEFSKNVETHIFNFDKELYGKKIIVEFLEKTRDEVKFDSLEDLAEQILRDCKEAYEYHKKNRLI